MVPLDERADHGTEAARAYQTDNLAIEDGFPSEGQSRSPAKILKELKGFPLREMS
jgi:hypothetical protein